MASPKIAQVKATEKLRQQILSGEIGPCKVLSEQSIAERFKLTRAPVRVAIQQLAFEGLVEVLPRRGTLVRSLTSQQMEEILVVREILETKVVEILADMAGGGRLDRARRVNAQMRNISRSRTTRSNVLQFTDLDLTFHCALASAAGFEETIAQFLSMLRNRFRLIAKPRGLGSSQITVTEHDAILNAIEKGRVVNARAALKTHLSNARERWNARSGKMLLT